MQFYYYVGKDEQVLRTLKVKADKLPELVMVHYNRESFGSREMFSIHPLEDPQKNGFRDFLTLQKTLSDVGIDYI